MKANEAPKKIYMPNELLSEEWQRHIEGEDTEYVRTDVFIEKAVDYIANNMRCDGYTLQTKAKFIKEFKNYMKGE